MPRAGRRWGVVRRRGQCVPGRWHSGSWKHIFGLCGIGGHARVGGGARLQPMSRSPRRKPRRSRHAGRETATRKVKVSENDEVREVRSGKEQGSGVGRHETSIEQRGLVRATGPREVDEDRRQEGNRCVEVEHCRDGRDDHRRSGEHRQVVREQLGEPAAHGFEQAVVVGDEADDQKPRDENEGGPVLGGGRTRPSRIGQRGGKCRRCTEAEKKPSDARARRGDGSTSLGLPTPGGGVSRHRWSCLRRARAGRWCADRIWRTAARRST